MALMGVVKALKPKKAWGQVSYTDRYLRGLLPQQIRKGNTKTDNALYDGLNCGRDTFTKSLRMHMKWYGEKKVKAYEYVQSFSPKDRRNGLTPELAHSLGMEFANRFFSDVPCLVVTHIDADHLHNQFLVGNVNVQTGKCLRLNAGTLNEMKLFFGRQCVRHGLIASVFSSYKSRNEQKRSDAEHLMKRQGKVPVKDQLYAQIRESIESADVTCFEDFLSYLSERYQIECRVSGNTISFKHPALSRPVRGTRMAADLTKEGIELGILLAVHEQTETVEEEHPDMMQTDHPLKIHPDFAVSVDIREEHVSAANYERPLVEPIGIKMTATRYDNDIWDVTKNSSIQEAFDEEVPISVLSQPAYRNLSETASIWRMQPDPEDYKFSKDVSAEQVEAETASAPAVLSPSGMEECKHLLDDLVSERRRIRDKLKDLIDKLNGLKKDLISLCRNIAFWKKEKEQLEKQLSGEIEEQAIRRPVSRGRSR